jgi:hypothetical protein
MNEDRMVSFAKPKGLSPRGAVFAAALSVFSCQPAFSSTQIFDGYDPGDPVGSAARKVWTDFITTCAVADGTRLTTAILGFEKTRTALSGDQIDYLLRQVTKGVRSQPNMDLLEVGDAIGLQAALTEMGNKDGAAKIERDLASAKVFMRVEGYRRGLELRLDIRVTSVSPDLACRMTNLDPFPVPMDFVGQQIKPLQNIVDPLVKDLFLSSRPGKQNILLNSKIIRGTDPSFSDPNVNLVLRSTFNTAIAKMRKDVDVTLKRTQSELPIFSVIPTTAEPADNAQDWTASVILRELGQV